MPIPIDIFTKSWLLSAPLSAIAVLGLVIALERIRVLVFQAPFAVGPAFLEKIRYLIVSDRLTEALALCEYFPDKPVVRVIKEGLLRAHQPETLIQTGLELIVQLHSENLKKRIRIFATLAHTANILGILGALIAISSGLEQVSDPSLAQKTQPLAAFFAQAFQSVFLGLFLAAVFILVHQFFSARSESLIGETKRTALWITDLLQQRFYVSEPSTDSSYRGAA